MTKGFWEAAQVSDKDDISEEDIHEHVLSVLTRK